MLFKDVPLAGLYGCVGVILGHDFPFYLGFKGGKGHCLYDRTCIMFKCHNIWYLPAFAFGIGIICIATTRYVSLGSMSFAVMIPIVLYRVGFSLEGTLIATCLAILALYQHRANIGRLLAGNENKLGTKRIEKIFKGGYFMKKIAVIGAGSWGTALAVIFRTRWSRYLLCGQEMKKL